MHRLPRFINPLILSCIALLSGCATTVETTRPESVFAVTTGNQLISFNAGRPGALLSSTRVSGLQADEKLLGMDFRPANGKLYALGNSGRLYVLDTTSGAATQVGTAPLAIMLEPVAHGFNVNPVVDRIRVVNGRGANMRLHPDTGSVVDADPNTAGLQVDKSLAYATTDRMAGKTPQVIAVAYTNSVPGVKATTNFAIDSEHGLLLTQGTREGLSPATSPVSPNTGQLFTVGALGSPPASLVAFDIAATGNVAFTALGKTGDASRFYLLDINTGTATLIGTIGGGEAIVALSVVPTQK